MKGPARLLLTVCTVAVIAPLALAGCGKSDDAEKKNDQSQATSQQRQQKKGD